jgi:hypothetical protein
MAIPRLQVLPNDRITIPFHGFKPCTKCNIRMLTLLLLALMYHGSFLAEMVYHTFTNSQCIVEDVWCICRGLTITALITSLKATPIKLL